MITSISPFYAFRPRSPIFLIQVALVIRGFDYSRTRKQGKISINNGKVNILKFMFLVFEDSKFLRNVTTTKSEGNLYSFSKTTLVIIS